MSSNDATSKKMGENLLRGWTMLGENCPNGCLVPLMRSRDKSQLVCVACDVDFNRPVQTQPQECKPVQPATIAPASDSNLMSSTSETASFISSLNAKLSWVKNLIDASSSVHDLSDLVALATQLVDLRTKLNTN